MKKLTNRVKIQRIISYDKEANMLLRKMRSLEKKGDTSSEPYRKLANDRHKKMHLIAAYTRDITTELNAALKGTIVGDSNVITEVSNVEISDKSVKQCTDIPLAYITVVNSQTNESNYKKLYLQGASVYDVLEGRGHVITETVGQEDRGSIKYDDRIPVINYIAGLIVEETFNEILKNCWDNEKISYCL